MYEVKTTYIDATRLLNLKRTTAYNIVKRAEQNHGEIIRPRGGHRHAKVTDAMRAVVRAVVEDHPHSTIRNINRELRTRLPQSPAVSQTPFLNICKNAFALWKGNIKDSLAEDRDQLLREDHQQRMATLGQLAEQGTAVVTLDRMQAAFRGMQAYLPACFGLEDILM